MAVALISWSCGQNVNYPAPTLTAISPTSTTTAQTNPFVLTAIGGGFVQQSAIYWNSTPLTTTVFVNTSELQATIPPSFYQTPGTAMITVVTPAPGGGTTTAITFSVSPTSSPVPHISLLSPGSVFTGGAAFTLKIFGTNFVQQSTVAVNGNTRQAGFVNSTEIDTSLNSTDIASPGALQINVINPINPPPGGGASNTVLLSVVNPLPTISGVSPANVQAGSASNLVSVTGTGFVNQVSYIAINGVQRTTTFVSSTQLTTPFTGSDLLIGGIDQVTVVNPAPGGGTSSILTLAVNPTHLLGLPVLVDIAPNGSQANDGICGGLVNCQNGTLGLGLSTSGPSSSTTGQYVAFASVSNNLLTGEPNNGGVVLVRNTCLGTASCTPATSIVSTDPNGNAANGGSFDPSIDAAASNAAFTSQATNLVTSVGVPVGTSQVYWRPVCLPTTAGCTYTPTTYVAQLISISADGLDAGNGASYNPSISSDGRYVAFVSLATNLVSGISPDGITPQIYLRDTCSGVSGTICTGTTYLVSTPDGTTLGNGVSSNPSAATSGLYVSFTSIATNLGATAPNPNGAQEIFERSTCLTKECTANTTLISTPDGVTAADGSSLESSISSTGRFIAFASTALNLVTGAGPTQQIYLRDTCIAVTTTCAPSTTLISLTPGGVPGNGVSEYPSINTTGQYVAFASFSSNIASTTNGVENIFVRNTCDTITSTTECTPSVVLVTQGAGSASIPANGNSLVPSISQDGTTASFLSFASNLVPRDNNGLEDIFLGSTTFPASTTITAFIPGDAQRSAEAQRSGQ